jgi:hypothetical protein
MSPSDAPFKKKSPPATLPRALEIGVPLRALVPTSRVAIPIGLAALGAIAWLELSAPAVDPDACASSSRPDIFERGAAAAREAFDRVTNRAFATPSHGTPVVAGGAMAVIPPTGTTTPIGPVSTVPATTGVIGPPMPPSTPAPTTSGKRKFVSPTVHVRPAGRPTNPHNR